MTNYQLQLNNFISQQGNEIKGNNQQNIRYLHFTGNKPWQF